MTKEEYLAIAAAWYDQFVALNRKDNFYDYEKEFVSILNDLGQEVLEKNLRELSKDKRKKKTLTVLGPVSINNSHYFSQGSNGFQISSRLQELMTYAGQLDSYQKANDIVKEFTAVEISTAQLYRVTDYYGERLSETVNAEQTLAPVQKEAVLYVEVDGSMLLSREQGWSEVKVGRCFTSSDCLHPGSKQGWIRESQYVAHLGGHMDFTAVMEPLNESYGSLGNRLVFIKDGAIWIKNWIEDAFPQAVSILDYYHACEHLHGFSSCFFKDTKKEAQWVRRAGSLDIRKRRGSSDRKYTAVASRGRTRTKASSLLRRQQRAHGLQKVQVEGLWPHWFRGNRISAPHGGTAPYEAVGAAMELQRGATNAKPKSNKNERALGTSHPHG